MMFHIVMCVRGIEEDARRYCKQPDAMLDADRFFPMVVWTVVHCGLKGVHGLLGHLERFAGDQKWRGQVGFAVTLIEGEYAVFN